MTLLKMTVTDSQGRTIEPPKSEGGSDTDLTGTYAYVYKDTAQTQKDPYRFWAIEIPDQSDAEAHEVAMILPLGGVHSGLYRYPKIGEQVLAAAEDSGWSTDYYMMGYVPSTSNPFNASLGNFEGSTRVLEEEGEMLRYINTAYGENAYSEIGFYKEEKAQWPMTAGKEDFPPIDVLVLDSAGNIRETAWNHHLQKAARIEILADAPEVIDRKTNAVDEHGTLPIGEYLGDDASLHRGDIHIRAGNRVVIKADQEIRLQVGRTTLRIDDTGFNVVTKNVTGNYANSYDTTLDMNPRNGINLTGKNINLKAGYRFNAGDGLGGSVATTMGNLNLGGREISIDSYNNTEYMFYILYQALEYLVNTASGAMALGKADIKIADYVKFSQDNLEALIKLARKANKLWAKRKEIVKQKKEEQRRREEAARQARLDFLLRALTIDPQEMLNKEDFIAKYGEEVYDAFVMYSTDPGYRAMNGYLRGIMTEAQLNAEDPRYMGYINTLNLFFQNKTIDTDTVVYRYFNPYPGYGGLNNVADDPEALVGKKITEAAFLSTAVSDDAHGSFAMGSSARLVLTMPAGSQAGTGLDGISQFPGEHEYLLPPGSSYRIDRVVQNPTTHKLDIYATLL
ncbi:MAG: hypothetical protein LBC31_10800 [Treponema sp.]|jgi:phage baseplate assembly protein gpV|nr:hypothetical protein [Treponema sp.]